MSNDYDDYSYEDGSSNTNKSGLIKKLIIVILVVIALIAIIFLLKSCSDSGDKEPKGTLSKDLLSAGKKYYDNNTHTLPVTIGECSTVTLETLKSLGLVNPSNYSDCNKETTYVQVCYLEDKSLHWTPWLTCTKENSDNLYNAEVEGTTKDLVKDETLITKFMFLPQMLNDEDSNLGKVEEIWKDDIKYQNYKTLATTTYYRYRDLEYIWNIKVKTYYASTGTTTDSGKAKEYYKSSPASGYNNKTSGETAYKWFTSSSKKVYYTSSSGNKAYSATAPKDYPYNEGGKIVSYYRTRKVLSTYFPTLYYSCAKSSTSTTYINQKTACGSGVNSEYKYELDRFYACEKDSPLKEVTKDTVCKNYGSWSDWSTKSCGNKSDVCDIKKVTFYYWYKLEGNSVKTYYPSKSTNANDEKVYYTSAPIEGAQKDESTKTTAYKWYKETDGQTTKYSATSPQNGATKTNTSKWSDWSDWSTKRPSSLGSAGTRKVESKVKIKLQEIKNVTEDNKWKNLSEEYITLEEMIKLYNDNKIEVTSLKDIANNGEVNYQVKMFIRNKKEGNK